MLHDDKLRLNGIQQQPGVTREFYYVKGSHNPRMVHHTAPGGRRSCALAESDTEAPRPTGTGTGTECAP